MVMSILITMYTKIRDDNPTRYVTGSKVVDSILADGCVIEGIKMMGKSLVFQ